MIVIPPQRRDPRQPPPEKEGARADISPASVVSIRVELRSQERELQRVSGEWRDVDERPRAAPARAVLAREASEPQPTAAEILPLAAAERAVAAYAFQRAQFEPPLAMPGARVDRRA